jgi:hypothetical protein
MNGLFASGGVMMWPILAVGVGIGWMGIRTALRLSRPDGVSSTGGGDEVARGLQGILFWGGAAVVLGLLGTTVGLVLMGDAVARAGAAHPPLVWGGLAVALVPLIFALVVFLGASVLWFILHQWHGGRVQPG